MSALVGRRSTRQFARVVKIGRSLPDVVAVTRYDGAPVLKVGGMFMAGLAMHASAEANSLVVRCDVEQRSWLLADDPRAYYVTDYYRRYPLVLVRLSVVDSDALHDLLSMSRRLTLAKNPRSRANVAAIWRHGGQ